LKAHAAAALAGCQHSFQDSEGERAQQCFESDMQMATVTAAKIEGVPGPKRRLWMVGALILMVSARAQTQSAGEYQIKAAFLYNFAKFVEWPQGDLADATRPFRICVLGQDPFGQELRDITSEKTVNGHRLQIVLVADLQQARTCQILFIASSEKAQLKKVLETLEGSSALTVGDSKGFVELGGMINFVLEDDRVRFEVNHKAAERAGLKISSKLLTIAKSVTE
jgi:YfiR/HmsC-like